MTKDTLDVARDWKSLGEWDRRALAYAASLTDNNALANLQRYSRSLALQAERSIKLLLDLNRQRLPPAEETLDEPNQAKERNEPNPNSGHSTSIGPGPSTRAVYDYATAPRATPIAVSPAPAPTPPKVATAGR